MGQTQRDLGGDAADGSGHGSDDEPRYSAGASGTEPYESARSFGQVAASLRRAGRKPAARAYDAMIAATALANDLAIHTCNPSDFAGIDGLTTVAVPHPDR